MVSDFRESVFLMHPSTIYYWTQLESIKGDSAAWPRCGQRRAQVRGDPRPRGEARGGSWAGCHSMDREGVGKG